MSVRRWKLTIEYNGENYSGWQRQEDGTPTIQSTIEDAFYKFCQQDVRLHVAGRTDAGVHAMGQIAHCDLDYGDRPISGIDLAKALNAHLRPAPITILNAEPVGEDFHARFSAKNKLYRYRFLCRVAPPALEQGRFWHIKKRLDVRTMQEGANHLLGEHDFTSFRDSQCQAKSPIKTLDRLDITAIDYDTQSGIEVRMEAEGRSFLHHQLRNIAGTLKLVGEGKWQPQDVKSALEARDRAKAGPTAPAGGLVLVKIDYDEAAKND